MGTRKVTIEDFMLPEFRGQNPDDYEFRGDGKIVRKDRWESGFRRIAALVTGNSRAEYEIEEIVTVVGRMVEEIPTMPEPCESCDGNGYTMKYFDAGDHFGGSSAPGSEWEKVCCAECNGSGKIARHPAR